MVACDRDVLLIAEWDMRYRRLVKRIIKHAMKEHNSESVKASEDKNMLM